MDKCLVTISKNGIKKEYEVSPQICKAIYTLLDDSEVSDIVLQLIEQTKKVTPLFNDEF